MIVSGGSAGKESACNVGDLGSVPGLGRSPGGGKGSPPQYSGLENSMDCIVHGVAKSRTWLSDFNSPLRGVLVRHWLSFKILAAPVTVFLELQVLSLYGPLPPAWCFILVIETFFMG